MSELTEKEKQKRESLKLHKPIVYDKVQKFKALTEAGKSTAIIQLQYNYACNFVCEHCSIKSIQDQGRAAKRRTLTPSDVKILADQAHEMGLARFEINGGEPFVNKDYDELVRAIGPERFYMNSVTNGWFLDASLARHLKEIGIDRIQVGLDSLSPEEHDEFRRKPGAHTRAMNAIWASQDAGLDVFATTVVTRQRLYSQEFKEFIEYFNSRGVPVFMTFAKPVGAWEGKFDMLVTKEDLSYAQSLEAKHNIFSHLTGGYDNPGGCLAFRGLIAVTAYGDVLPCQYIFVSMGNIFEEPLKDIIGRGLKLQQFKTETCPIAEDRDFIDKYIVNRVYGKELPVPCDHVFTEE